VQRRLDLCQPNIGILAKIPILVEEPGYGEQPDLSVPSYALSKEKDTFELPREPRKLFSKPPKWPRKLPAGARLQRLKLKQGFFALTTEAGNFGRPKLECCFQFLCASAPRISLTPFQLQLTRLSV
jgi:hypothetical protein